MIKPHFVVKYKVKKAPFKVLSKSISKNKILHIKGLRVGVSGLAFYEKKQPTKIL